ncbi:MAG: TssQ family T6SS-associated lipoprotein [Aquabacterium sp.]|nr:TssQ family T6SS-associated lipoprotein [Aquabacterium sp.]
MKNKDADSSAAALAAPPVVAASAPASVAEEPVIKKPTAAEMSLADGLKAYQGGQYRMAETQLKTALQAGLTSPADVANAHKHLAFIYCTSKRDSQCLAAFKAAKAADPSFALSKAEAGHPMWARTYKKAMGLK